MTTDDDPIAEQYKRSKFQPWRTYIESYSLVSLIGGLAGKTVVDIACGEGFYTRILRHLGAAKVTGIDLSVGMIELAQSQERAEPLGIEYVVGDGRDLKLSEPCDVAVAAYLLNYAHDRAELQSMCDGIARALKPGGRFVTVNSSASLKFPAAPSFNQYGFETIAGQPWQEGTPITWRFHLDDGDFELENYYLNEAVHEDAFRRAGFREIRWHAPRISPDVPADFAPDFWDTFLAHPPVSLIECVK